MNLSLDQWIHGVLPGLRAEGMRESNLKNVTLLAYFFWDDDRINTKFYAIECAFLCAFHNFGVLPAVLVVNRLTPKIESFCKRYGIEVQTDVTLTGGVPRMNLNCIENLYKRFRTDYVLVIQSDGFPLSPGLENFLGDYDYFGAPWPVRMTRLDVFPYPKYFVGNGGFTLRSRRLCELASDFYRRYFRWMPYNWFVVDDVFYCKTLRFLSLQCRRTMRFPSLELAGRFSVELGEKFLQKDRMPLGFHNVAGFDLIVKHYGVPMQDLIRP